MMTGVNGSFDRRACLDLQHASPAPARRAAARCRRRSPASRVLRDVGRDDGGGEARHVFDDGHAVAVVDEAARRDHRLDAELVQRGALLELRAVAPAAAARAARRARANAMTTATRITQSFALSCCRGSGGLGVLRAPAPPPAVASSPMVPQPITLSTHSRRRESRRASRTASAAYTGSAIATLTSAAGTTACAHAVRASSTPPVAITPTSRIDSYASDRRERRAPARAPHRCARRAARAATPNAAIGSSASSTRPGVCRSDQPERDARDERSSAARRRGRARRATRRAARASGSARRRGS